MFCGHCGNAVGEADVFCNSCGARFLDAAEPAAGAAGAAGASVFAAPGAPLPEPQWAAEPTVAAPATGAAPPPPPPTGPPITGAGTAAFVGQAWPSSATAVDPTMAIPVADPSTGPPPPPYVPLTSGPGQRGWRPFAIGAAFALIAVAGVVAYFALRGDETDASPDPTGAPVLVATTTTTVPTTSTTVAPTLAPTTVPPTEAPTTVPPTEPPTTPPTTLPTPATTGNGPTPTVAPITVAPTAAPPATSAPATTRGTVAPPATPRPTAAPTTVPPPTTAATQGNVPASMSATVGAVRSSATRPDGVDSCGKPTDYSPVNLLDGTNASAWMTVGSGGGQYVEFTVRKGVEVSTVGLVPGYAKLDPCSGSDRFLDMRRIFEVGWTFDGGDEIIQQLDVESATMQTIDLPEPVAATKVRMTIRVTTPPGTAGFDYAPVSEVTVA